MSARYFQFENDPLKHYVRTKLWLPYCQERLSALRKGKKTRRLRYFTFCAAGAIDVLMLNVHKVVLTSSGDKFDNVTFFDKDPESVNETAKNIPGASGFPGDFTAIVQAFNQSDIDLFDSENPLSPLEAEHDTLETEKRQILRSQFKSFILRFPFDVINLDLEELIFKQREPPPGKVINTLRKILDWQKRPINGVDEIKEFTLFFTTQIGPRNLTEQHIDSLIGCLKSNVELNDEVKIAFKLRVTHTDPEKLFKEDFQNFYKIAVPKILVKVLNENDWHINPANGISIYEFERNSSSGPYIILHLGMHVERMNPPKERRMAWDEPQGYASSYSDLTKRIFTEKPIVVTDDQINAKELLVDLQKVVSRRKKYNPEQ